MKSNLLTRVVSVINQKEIDAETQRNDEVSREIVRRILFVLSVTSQVPVLRKIVL